MGMIRAADGTILHDPDRGPGPVVLLSRGWPLQAGARVGPIAFPRP